jgi:hypothetical protein
MWQPSFLDRIRETLRAQHVDVVREPLPRRWIDLIHYLNEREEAKANTTDRRLSRGWSARGRLRKGNSRLGRRH